MAARDALLDLPFLWTGLDLATFIERCRPLPHARYVVFHAFDDEGTTEPFYRARTPERCPQSRRSPVPGG